MEPIALVDNQFFKIAQAKGAIQIKLHRQLKSIVKSAIISCHSSGKYYVSLLCKEEIVELPKTNSAIGIDLGITDFAILSVNQKIVNNKFTSNYGKETRA